MDFKSVLGGLFASNGLALSSEIYRGVKKKIPAFSFHRMNSKTLDCCDHLLIQCTIEL